MNQKLGCRVVDPGVVLKRSLYSLIKLVNESASQLGKSYEAGPPNRGTVYSSAASV